MYLPRRSLSRLLITGLVFIVSACGPSEHSITADQAKVEYDLVYTTPEEPLSFREQVLPVLEKRCVSCHGCYDAPCQLKLGSSEGIRRGANKLKVYDGARITAAEPTRLFIDAVTTAQWRDKGFTPILHEGEAGESGRAANPVRNLENSVLYRMLRLKQLQPQPRTGMLGTEFDLSLNREQTCPTLEEFDDYAEDNPHGGMPFGLPNLNRQEYSTLVHWIAQGAPVEDELQPSAAVMPQITAWEAFLNQKSDDAGEQNRFSLVSRYLYEHLFQAHLHFAGSGDREFYRLVRSYTPPGEQPVAIATRRPYGDVGYGVYYRLVRHRGSIVDKQHQVYSLSEQRMKRLRELFYETEYKVESLPSYEPHIASNPIKAFADIPVSSRYRFLLDDAQFFIEGFIKGPVCRGQVALNVIEDQFWVAFFDPDAPVATNDDDFLRANADLLATPSELEDTFRVLSVHLHYRSLFREYVQEREKPALDRGPMDVGQAMRYIWDGDGKTNPNAALTIFRHTDSASVSYGWQGDYPETAWVIDYSILERIHYLLVAGFDVYGNLGHQLTTRLYMDFLRTEGENYFLALLPVETRKQLVAQWYQGIRASNRDDQGEVQWINKELVNAYRTDNPQRELYQHMEARLGKLAGDGDYINRCANGCDQPADPDRARADRAMRSATGIGGESLHFLPDLAFVRVMTGRAPENDLAYSMIYNKAYKSVSNMLLPEELDATRDYSLDTQTILPWLEGSYPNFFYVVELDDVERFVGEYNAISNREHYESFIMRYGVRRTNEDFWEHADWFNSQHLLAEPVKAGIFDLNRYQNR